MSHKHKPEHHHPDEVNIKEEEISIREVVKIYNQTGHIFHNPPVYRLVLTSLVYQDFTINNSIIMALTINANQFVVGTLGLVDHASGNPVTATFANITFLSSDSVIFTAAQSTTDPTSVTVTAMSAGTGTLTVTADATFVDPTTGNSTTQTKTLTVGVTVSAVGTSTDLVVNFGPAQNKP